jgi:hypothetical protein
MKWLAIVCATLIPTADMDRDPRPAPTRWPGMRDDRVPLPHNGACPGSFETPWNYDRKHGQICVRRA